jgi:hypothetical protein
MFSRAVGLESGDNPSVSIREIRVLVLRNHAPDRSIESDGDRFPIVQDRCVDHPIGGEKTQNLLLVFSAGLCETSPVSAFKVF